MMEHDVNQPEDTPRGIARAMAGASVESPASRWSEEAGFPRFSFPSSK